MSGLTELAECVDRFGSKDAKRALHALLHTDPRRPEGGSIYPELGPIAQQGLDLQSQVEQLRQHTARIEHQLIVLRDHMRGLT